MGIAIIGNCAPVNGIAGVQTMCLFPGVGYAIVIRISRRRTALKCRPAADVFLRIDNPISCGSGSVCHLGNNTPVDCISSRADRPCSRQHGR